MENNSHKTAMKSKNPIPGNKPFQKGKSGNPSGRPKGSLNRSTIFAKWGEIETNTTNPLTGTLEKLSNDDILALNLIKAGTTGNVQAIKEYFDNRFGKQTEKLDASVNTPEINLTLEQKEAIVRKYLDSN